MSSESIETMGLETKVVLAVLDVAKAMARAGKDSYELVDFVERSMEAIVGHGGVSEDGDGR